LTGVFIFISDPPGITEKNRLERAGAPLQDTTKKEERQGGLQENRGTGSNRKVKAVL
jgi:hypothetical protein